ncbi:MAG: 1-acyl-sn-glycerol-3-phosphate acyltransferase [Cyanobacteria bacterium P01_F01_bin.53]
MTADSKTATRTPSAAASEVAPSFYPPIQWPLMARLVQSISYPLARQLFKFRIAVSEESVGRVRSVDNGRLVFVCNHPTLEDGITLFVLSSRLGQLFHYIVAYESFKGLMGWFIQRLGCYSIRRGLGDRASISQTLSLLKQPRCRLVIFPEGGCSYQNDTIMPFRPGAIQLPMSVLAQLAKKAPSPEQIPDFYLVPVSLKYRYGSPMGGVIDSTLSRMEAELKISVTAGNHSETPDNYHRLRQVAHAVILKLENEARENGMPLPDTGTLSWNERIEHLRHIFIQKCENLLNIEPNLNMPIRERVYKVQALLEDVEDVASEQATSEVTKNDPPASNTPENQGSSPVSINRKEVYWDTVRLLNFDAIYDGYVAESPTPERFLDTLVRLEREVFHLEHPRPKAPRKACFYIGEPINLKSYLSDFQRDRSGTIDRLSEELRQIMQSNLDRT